MKVADLTLKLYLGMPRFPVKWYPAPEFEDILHVDNDPAGAHRYASKERCSAMAAPFWILPSTSIILMARRPLIWCLLRLW